MLEGIDPSHRFIKTQRTSKNKAEQEKVSRTWCVPEKDQDCTEAWFARRTGFGSLESRLATWSKMASLPTVGAVARKGNEAASW